jgi:hypothetical protein
VKIRSGPPKDEDEDVEGVAVWAGVLPLRQSWGDPEPCPLLPEAFATPARVLTRTNGSDSAVT